MFSVGMVGTFFVLSVDRWIIFFVFSVDGWKMCSVFLVDSWNIFYVFSVMVETCSLCFQ